MWRVVWGVRGRGWDEDTGVLQRDEDDGASPLAWVLGAVGCMTMNGYGKEMRYC